MEWFVLPQYPEGDFQPPEAPAAGAPAEEPQRSDQLRCVLRTLSDLMLLIMLDPVSLSLSC